jgi:hypothetical protein
VTSDALNHVTRDDVIAILRAGVLLAVVDGVCALAINGIFFNQHSFVITFQGIATALMGKPAFAGGSVTVLLGIVMHLAVALFWVTLYAVAYSSSAAIRHLASGWLGIAKAGAPLGAIIWLTMNFVVFPMTRLHANPVTSLPFEIFLVQHVIVVGPLVVASLK